MTNPDSAASAASALLPHNQPHSKTGLQAQLDAQPISPLQWRVIILCWLVNMLDGFDLLAISFAAPAIAKAWQLAPQTLGVVFSSGLLGMMAGSLIFGPAADHIGRRRMIIFACLVLAISMLATAHANSVGQLMLLRGITGMAIGALLPSLNTLVAEYTPDRRKNLAISFMHVGYPIGGIAGGWLASQLIPTHGWPALFWLGGLFTLAIVPIIFFGLPESLHYLLQKNQPAAKAKAVKIARRMGLTIQSDILNIAAKKTNLDQASRQTLRTLLHRPWLAPSLALWTCFFLSNLTLYFLLNWTPSILTTAGLPASQAMRAGMLLNFGGVIAQAVLVKGAHEQQPHRIQHWLWVGGVCVAESRWPRLSAEFHGSGCSLASHIAGLLAQGVPLQRAVAQAEYWMHTTLSGADRPHAQGQRIPRRF